eukprot:2000241-Prymnesium_polylepis.1
MGVTRAPPRLVAPARTAVKVKAEARQEDAPNGAEDGGKHDRDYPGRVHCICSAWAGESAAATPTDRAAASVSHGEK